MSLPDLPVGDYTLMTDALGDYSTLTIPEAGDLDTEEAGDLSDESGSGEVGAPARYGATGRAIAKIAAGRPTKKVKLALARKPRGARIATAAAQARATARNLWCTFEHLEGAKFIDSTLGLGSRLRHYETIAIQNLAVQFPPVPPKVVNFTLASGSGSIEIDGILVSLFGLTDGGPAVPWIGAKLILAAPELYRAPGTNVTITHDIGAGLQSVVANIELTSHKITSYSFVNGAIVSGRARAYIPNVAPDATPAGNYTVSVSGVPANYTAQLRLIMPGDTEAERFLTLL
jgi:hypothetical protein